ncbi:uncharacterized protein LOC124170444 [Ischnura elegans]|uniref:uncharacterized protein LOC124170444 n=1 Tax=Ischnura elegans TaxID=197161 RepID=UPI001ED8A2AF|nr:uncharacterized protein LOC124170444 [Ischnura elegans]
MRLWLTVVLWLGSSLVLTEETPPPSKRHKCPDATPSTHLLCYHWGELTSSALDPCVCTHLVLPSKETKDGYQLDTDKIGSSALSDLRNGNPSLRLLLGVDAAPSLRGAPSHALTEFARSTAKHLKEARLDGLEVNLGEDADDADEPALPKRKEGVLTIFKALREEMNGAQGTESDKDRSLLLRLPVCPETLAKTYDLKPLSKYVDYFTVSTHNITDDSERDVTYHHSRLMGLADILNTDSVLDLLTGMGAPPSKLIISMPTQALTFSLKDEKNNVARSPVEGEPQIIDYNQVCAMMKEGGWTVERDEDLTAPYAFRNKTWVAFEDETSVTIKGKYALLRGLAGVAVSSIDADDSEGICGKGPFPLTNALRKTLSTLSRKPRGLVLQSLEEELRGGETVALPEASLGAEVRLSPFRIVRVVDREGAVHVIRRNSETSFQCSRQGYFRHPLGCNQFYRCVKFDQLVDDFSVFEYDCPPGLAFDEKWEVCVWPGQMSRPCDGSSEIAPVPRARFTCPAEGYYADPENCRWFFACLDHHGDPSVAGRDATDPHSGLTAYEFRCPFGLAFDGSRLACEWPWFVPGCGKVEIGSGVLAAVQPARIDYSLQGGFGAIAASNAVHRLSHSDSGTVASVLGGAGNGGARVLSGASHIGGISHDLHSLGGGAAIGYSGAAGVPSGGSLIGLGGATLDYAQPAAGVVSHGSNVFTGNGFDLRHEIPPRVAPLGGVGLGNVYTNQAQVVGYDTGAPASGFSYASRPAIVTGYQGNLKAVPQAQGSLGLFGANGARGVSVSNVGLSGIGSGGTLGYQAVTTAAPLEAAVVTDKSHVYTSLDDASKYTASVSTAAPTSRPLSLVRTNVFASTPISVTPTPITYQSPRPTFLPQANFYLSSAPAVGSGSSSFSYSRDSQPDDGSLNTGTAFGLGSATGSEGSEPRSGDVKYYPRPLTTYRSESYSSPTYSSAATPAIISSYSIDASPPRTGGLVPVRPIETSSVYTSSERPLAQVGSYPAYEAARSAPSSEGGSVGNVVHQGSQSLFSDDGGSNRAYDSAGLGQIRDDAHAVTGDGSSRPSLVSVSSNSQASITPVLTEPENRFSYKNLPLSILDAAAPVFGSTGGTSSTFFHQSPPQRVYTSANVSPAPSLVQSINDGNHLNIISTTPNYDQVHLNFDNQRRGGEGFSYKRILPVVEYSTPLPVVPRISLEDSSARNRENLNVKTVRPVFTTTEAPHSSVSVEDNGYGSRTSYDGNNQQPVAYTSSHGTSGIIQQVQLEHQTPAPYNPSYQELGIVQEDYTPQFRSTPTVFVSTTPQPPSTASTVSYSTEAPVPISKEPTVFFVPSRGSTRHRLYSSTTPAPVLVSNYPAEQHIVDDVSSFPINRVPQNSFVSTTFAPPVAAPSVQPIVQIYNQSADGYRGIGTVTTFRPAIQLGRGSFSSDDKDGPVSVTADVKASYGNRPSKRVKVDVLLKEDDDEPHISIETDSGKVGRGRYRYRARGGEVSVNGKKKCDDENEQSGGQDYSNVDALLDTYSGNFGSVLNNGERGLFSTGTYSGVDSNSNQAVEIGNLGRQGYNQAILRGDQGIEDDNNGAYGERSTESQPQLALGVTVNSAARNGRPRIRGRFKPSNVITETSYSSTTPQYYDRSETERNVYISSSLPTVAPIYSSTVAIPSGNIQRNGNGDVTTIYTGNVGQGNGASTSAGSPIDLSHAAVIILPCGKLPALLAKLGAVTQSLKAIEQEESSSGYLRVARKQSAAPLSLPPLNKFGPNGWDSVEKTLGNEACKRAGLFRHPSDCNRFYECFWDEKKRRYTLHEFKCPIRLAYDDSLGACNWPTSGPACSGNKLLV